MFTLEEAEQAIADLCDKHGLDFAYISDTGTVENLLEEGYTLADIALGRVSKEDFLDNAYPLD